MHRAVQWPICRVALLYSNKTLKLDLGGHLSSVVSGVFRSHETVSYLVLKIMNT